MTFTGIALSVAYLLIPTSNHNRNLQRLRNSKLYIFWFLHQTTTMSALSWSVQSCISFDSYIKPQLADELWVKTHGCISFDSYIKPQLLAWAHWQVYVVYLLIPTSNHNNTCTPIYLVALYIFWFLHQTTTCSHPDLSSGGLYIFWFLHQTTTGVASLAGAGVLYIFWFLHQTTTTIASQKAEQVLYIFWFLHQTTTSCRRSRSRQMLYIFWFLHQTTTYESSQFWTLGLYIFWFLHQTTTGEAA